MRRIAALVTMVFLAAGAAYAQSDRDVYRFEVSVEKGKASVLSGPDIKELDNGSARIGWNPSKNFQLNFTYSKWEGEIARDDVLGERFAVKYNKQFQQADQRVFRDALLDKRDFEMKIYEVGIAKTIPFGKRFESFIGIQIGFTDAVADVTWTGAQTRIGGPAVPTPSFHEEDKSSFTTSVRGGLRWAPVGWFALQASLKVSPIGSVFDEDINTMELNGGLVFRFGKFK